MRIMTGITEHRLQRGFYELKYSSTRSTTCTSIPAKTLPAFRESSNRAGFDQRYRQWEFKPTKHEQRVDTLILGGRYGRTLDKSDVVI